MASFAILTITKREREKRPYGLAPYCRHTREKRRGLLAASARERGWDDGQVCQVWF